jgi:branched-chain amino acid transport system permease protein
MAELPLDRVVIRPPRRRGRREALLLAAFVFLLLAVPLAAQLLDEPFYIRFMTRLVIMALAALSLDLILGYGGMVSFGHAAFVGIGAYVTGILAYHGFNGEPLTTWPLVVGGSENAYLVWPLAVAAAALAALVIGAISLRTTGIPFIMITLAFAQMLYFFFIALQKYGGEDGLQMFERSRLPPLDIEGKLGFYYLCLAILLVALYLLQRLVASRFGMVLRGCRQNERRLRAIGFPTFRYRLAAFVISGALAGLAGALLANSQTYVSPADMAWGRSGELIVMVVLGGMGTLVGPLLGTAAFLLLELLIGEATIHWQAILGPIIILVVLFARRGLWGALIGSGGEGA